ncbi:MAG: hypothetical protein HCA25_24175 [Dolichospermum sp. DET50]|nr:hypothetical protein [Dolichospermum sp. DET66]MBS3035252.1 hypothetical protein [Dolichospermum sp. DET67]MBS3040452.1 hypothetical protein [Dolichospermum sp. DET50]QSX67594.1 MAG: hypothetical protein EZY12_23450 [Dolichospermum sp. DET69]
MKNFNVSTSSLLKDSLSIVKKIYFSMLLFFIPQFVFYFLTPEYDKFFKNFPSPSIPPELPPSSEIIIMLIVYFCVIPFTAGCSIYYVHQSIVSKVTVPQSLQASGEKFIKLALITILLIVFLIPAFLLLVIPAIYLSFRWSFIYYAVMIENSSVLGAFQLSWNLTKGRWWVIVRASLWCIVLFIPELIIYNFIPADAEMLNSLVSASYSLIVNPIIATYYVFLFFRLNSLYKDNQQQQ